MPYTLYPTHLSLLAWQTAAAVARAREMVEQGVDIIDVGGQSTRPGARILSAGQELKRVLPVIRCALKPL